MSKSDAVRKIQLSGHGVGSTGYVAEGNFGLGDVLAETHCNMSDGCCKFDYAALSW
jgi:hypothetical protein